MRKFLNSLMFRSCCAVIAGGACVFAFVTLLSLYGTTQEPSVQTAAGTATLPFPENEQMLDLLSEQLARENNTLTDIEPAAGGGQEQ